MKNRTFYATFLLFLLAVHMGILVLSVVALRNTRRQAQEQCLSEQYFISAALYQDMAALEGRGIAVAPAVEELLRPYGALADGRDSALSLYENGELLFGAGGPDEWEAGQTSAQGWRQVSLQRREGRYWCSVSGTLPAPFERYLLLYETDVTGRIEAWRNSVDAMLLAGGVLSLVLALFLLLLLGRLFRPLSQITTLSRQIAAGDYTARLPDEGRDEVAQMARSFNHMAAVIEGKVTELAEAAEDRQRFVDNFAHELRTPLTSVYGYAEYLQRAALDTADAQLALETILSESRRMQQMASRLMELSNLRHGEIRLERQDLPKLLASMERTLSGMLEDRDVRLQIRCQARSVTGDGVLLHSLLVNLVENAVKASAKGGVVDVAAEERNGAVILTVADHGRGMEPAELTHITEPYYRVDRSRNRREGGAGLGLALCREIAERHGAVLTFQSDPGQGTTATVTFTVS